GPKLSAGPVIGSGGYLGTLGSSVALLHFATVGGLILASSVTLGGLLLCTDYALFDVIVVLYKLVSRSGSLASDKLKPVKTVPGGKRNRTDLEDSIPGDVSVKIRGKPAQSAVAVMDDDEQQPADEDDAEAPVALRVVNPAAEKAESGPSSATARQDPPENPLR